MSDVADHNPDDPLTEYGTATTAYLLMAMSIDSLEHRNKQLETENAELRGERDMYHYLVGCMVHSNTPDQLKRENAELRDEIEHLLITRQHIEDVNTELRELCADMWEAIKTHKRINFAQLLRFGERIRKLGIEVD